MTVTAHPLEPGEGVSEREVALAWSPTPAVATTATVALLALLLAVVSRRAELLVLAAGPLALLALAPRGATPPVARVAVRVTPDRVSEGEPLVLAVSVTLAEPVEHLTVRLEPRLPLLEAPAAVGSGASATASAEVVEVDTAGVAAQWWLRPGRWGRWELGRLSVSATARGRQRRTTSTVDIGLCEVFPHIEVVRTLLRPARLPRLTGDHVSAEVGAGVEFAGTRPYVDGDPARLVHWSSSARRGRLYVTQRHAERLADLVFVVDAFSDVGTPPQSTLDVAVRAATSLAAGYLRAGDRVGALLLTGGVLRSVPLGLGRAQLTQVVELFLDARRAVTSLEPELDLLPRRALPPGALVVVVTPLLDQRVLDVLARLRERGSPTVVLDVLDPASVAPIWSGPVGALAVRLWRLDRETLLDRLRELGAVVVPAADLAGLATRLSSLRSRMLARSRS